MRAFVSIIMFSAIAGAEVASAEIPKARPYADQRTNVVERESTRERYLTRMKMERRMVYVPDDGSIAQPWWKSILPRIGPRSGWRREWQDVLVPVTEVDRIPVHVGQLTLRPEPVAEERSLRLERGRRLDLDVCVAPRAALGVLAQVLVADVVTSDPCRLAVDDDDLPVVAEVQLEPVVSTLRPKSPLTAACTILSISA